MLLALLGNAVTKQRHGCVTDQAGLPVTSAPQFKPTSSLRLCEVCTNSDDFSRLSRINKDVRLPQELGRARAGHCATVRGQLKLNRVWYHGRDGSPESARALANGHQHLQ